MAGSGTKRRKLTEQERLAQQQLQQATPRPLPNEAQQAGAQAGANIRRSVGGFIDRFADAEKAAIVRSGEARRAEAQGFRDIGSNIAGFAKGVIDPSIAPPQVQPPEQDVGQSQTNGTPGSEVRQPLPFNDPVGQVREPLPFNDPVQAEQQPTTLSEIRADGTREVPRPPDGIEVIRGTRRSFQPLNEEGSTLGQQEFRLRPGQTVEQSRESAVAADPARQFIAERDIRQQEADAATTRAGAAATQARATGQIIGADANGKLRVFIDDGTGQMVAAPGITPKLDALINGPDQIDVIQEFDAELERNVIKLVNATRGTVQNLTKEEAVRMAVAWVDRLKLEGEDQEDAIEEAEEKFKVTLQPTLL